MPGIVSTLGQGGCGGGGLLHAACAHVVPDGGVLTCGGGGVGVIGGTGVARVP